MNRTYTLAAILLLAVGVLAAAGIYTARRANSRSEWGSARAARRVGRRRRPGPPT